ncbi:hypothetical protein B0T22DRAFT_33227 [Podospora appendiculata]|uniref:Secreted protein n=1 Tax=Podospora appendiculata TaxID=314037 RepID=A0AAE1CG35_9PEZI|nr:hypothetical protein B0T22DRAFT_33227 [Podospora appendiculata]
MSLGYSLWLGLAFGLWPFCSLSERFGNKKNVWILVHLPPLSCACRRCKSRTRASPISPIPARGRFYRQPESHAKPNKRVQHQQQQQLMRWRRRVRCWLVRQGLVGTRAPEVGLMLGWVHSPPPRAVEPGSCKVLP